MMPTSTIYERSNAIGGRKLRGSKRTTLYSTAMKRNERMLKCVYTSACHPSKVKDELNVKKLFNLLADEWSRETANVSSISALTSHRSYQEIVRLGWEVVPLLLADLQTNRRFWFPALHEITQIRPFDPSDAGNSKRMTDAWIKWGQRKQLI
jgi:hypothetical protein